MGYYNDTMGADTYGRVRVSDHTIEVLPGSHESNKGIIMSQVDALRAAQDLTNAQGERPDAFFQTAEGLAADTYWSEDAIRHIANRALKALEIRLVGEEEKKNADEMAKARAEADEKIADIKAIEEAIADLGAFCASSAPNLYLAGIRAAK